MDVKAISRQRSVASKQSVRRMISGEIGDAAVGPRRRPSLPPPLPQRQRQSGAERRRRFQLHASDGQAAARYG